MYPLIHPLPPRDVGHFTQLVWASSSAVGCGMALGNGGSCVVGAVGGVVVR